ncbi:beta-propeller domain-containing protein [Sunxiuqinia sp. A32]|uniref:beta-propeller domain-containing protein n=1 Tax=Sunxiuqinia sp. A32 TaxID=3461496 RepID=UPI00404640B1
MKNLKKLSYIKILTFIIISTFNTELCAQSTNTALPGTNLSKFDFFYAGEAKVQDMYIVKNGSVVWEHKGPKDKGEISDAVLMSNGNVLFAHQRGITLISADQKVLWSYDTPEGCETHTAQPIGKKYVVFLQNGDPAKVFVVNVKNGKTVKSFDVAVENPKNVHGHFRHARLTPRGTYLISHMEMGKVVEYDTDGNVLFSMDAPGIWSAEPLENDNILLCGSDRWIREVDREGNVIWDIRLNDYPEYNLTSPQVAVRRANGNTIINNWFNQWSGEVDKNNPPYQAIEVTPDKKVVWALKSWEAPDLGPSTIIQVLNEKGISEKVRFGEFK